MDYFGLISILLFLSPIVLVGYISLKGCTGVSRFELILPASFILGIVLFIVLLNSVSFLVKPPISIIISYLFFLIVSILNFEKIKDFEIPKGRVLLFLFTSLLLWGALIFWKSAFALFGSDANLYYSIASSFTKGNFPFVTPWQPDVALSYHVGILELLGAFEFLTNFSFEFLHVFFSFIFILCSSQIIIWIWDRHREIKFFFLANLAAASVLISFGLFKLVIPNSLEFPIISSVHDLLIWLRELPSTSQTIEPYGVPVDLDSLIYIIFHAAGLSVTLTMILILVSYNRKKKFLTWVVLFVGLVSLAIIHEVFFMVAAPAVILGIVFVEYKEKTLRKNVWILFVGLMLLSIVTVLQGGVIGSSLFQDSTLEKTIVLFPRKEDIKADFWQYHLGNELTRMLPNEDKWQPFRWVNIGVEILLVLSILILWQIKLDLEKKALLIVLFVIGVSSIVCYNVIVPKYILANGNRFIAIGYQFFALFICLSQISIFKSKYFKNLLFSKFVLLIIVFCVVLPTFVPIFAKMTKTRFGESKFNSSINTASPTIKWIADNIHISRRIMVFDARTPHPSAVANLMIGSGNLTPLFPKGYRSYTIEPSPDYLDVALSLNPSNIERLNFSVIILDDSYYKVLPELRRKQLLNSQYFKLLYEYKKSGGWEKVLEINQEYLKEGGELPGTLAELNRVAPKEGRYYIDSEHFFKEDFLRRPIIFSLRDRDLYFPSESGVYLNVEAYVSPGGILQNSDYDYLLLSSRRNPNEICSCKSRKIWESKILEITLWEKDKNPN